MAEDIKELFGKRVRQLRKALGLSQEAFAYQINMDRSYYGSIERGERNVSLDNISLIAGGLGVSAAELLQFDDAPSEEKSLPPKPARSPSKTPRTRSRRQP